MYAETETTLAVGAIIAIVIVSLLVSILVIGGIVWGSIVAYKHGKRTGNLKVTIILIAIAVVTSVTLIPGLCHLIGASKVLKYPVE